MKKQSFFLILTGVAVLAIAGFFVFINSNEKQGKTETKQNVEPKVESPLVIYAVYTKEKTINPDVTKLVQGQRVVIRVTSEIADEVHFHGYDLHVDLEANKPGEIAFTANQTGRFEFELEGLKKTLGFIEVYPR